MENSAFFTVDYGAAGTGDRVYFESGMKFLSCAGNDRVESKWSATCHPERSEGSHLDLSHAFEMTLCCYFARPHSLLSRQTPFTVILTEPEIVILNAVKDLPINEGGLHITKLFVTRLLVTRLIVTGFITKLFLARLNYEALLPQSCLSTDTIICRDSKPPKFPKSP